MPNQPKHEPNTAAPDRETQLQHILKQARRVFFAIAVTSPLPYETERQAVVVKARAATKNDFPVVAARPT